MVSYPPKKILVPVDFSEHSTNALKAASNIARIHNSEMTIFHVVRDPIKEIVLSGAGEMGTPAAAPFASESWETLKEEAWQDAEKGLTEILFKIPGVDNVRKELQWGHRPADQIVQTAYDQDFDLIVMATRGREGIKRLLLGSVAERVISTTSTPTMVIPVVDQDIMKEKIDIQTALLSPSSIFSHPEDVLFQPELAHGIKLKILNQWKLDAENLATATGENMAGGEESLLTDVVEAILRLEKSQSEEKKP